MNSAFLNYCLIHVQFLRPFGPAGGQYHQKRSARMRYLASGRRIILRVVPGD